MSSVNKHLATFSLALLTVSGAASTAVAQAAAPAGNDLQKGQTTVNGQVMQNGEPTGSGATSVRQGIQSQLQQAGYTDVNVMPSSFYVRAKDRQGRPVAMVIGPNSVTAVTEVPVTGEAASNAKGGTGAAP